jgi:hypothetical protein
MEFNREVAHYIIRFHRHLMRDSERRAQSHLFGTLKATLGRSDASAQEEARKSRAFSQWLSDDPDVLRLVRDGYEAFEARTAKRILEECGDKVVFNCCPKCTGLARTPTAKQCRLCGHDWHDRE